MGGDGDHQVIGAGDPAHSQFPHQVPGGRDRAQAGTHSPPIFLWQEVNQGCCPATHSPGKEKGNNSLSPGIRQL